MRATLYWSATGGTDLSTYTRALFPTGEVTFKCSTSQTVGSWFGKTIELGTAGNGIANGQLAYCIAVGWDSNASSDPISWDAMSKGFWGSSAVFTYIPPTVSTPPPRDYLPQNLRSFEVQWIPEPTALWLSGLGAAALLIFRRRDRAV
jgi:hypothetical protein